MYGKLPNKKDLLDKKLKVGIWRIEDTMTLDLINTRDKSANTSTLAITPCPRPARLMTLV